VSAACLYVAGALAATVPAAEFTLQWNHSVQKTQWVERYRVERDALRLVEASVQGSGAGMEPAPDAAFAEGRWTWRPDRVVPELSLRRSGFTADYTICAAGRCDPLSRLAGPAGPDAVVTIRPCAGR
jgi:hypothetical protein